MKAELGVTVNMEGDQQINNWDMRKPDVDNSWKDFRSIKKKSTLLVTFLAFLLPLLITSSYIYLNTNPGTSTEAMMIFRRQPFSMPFKGKTSLFDHDASGSDSVQVEPGIEDTENTTDDSLGAKPVENNTEVAEDVKAQKLYPSETDISANETTTLGRSEQEQANATAAELENSTPLDVNATKVESDAGKQNTPRDSSNKHSPEIEHTENTTDSLSANPVEDNTESDAMAEEGKRVSSTSAAVNATAVESDAGKQSKVPDENPNNHQQSEPSLIAMESHTKGVCDLAKGSWVPDSRPPQYTNATCHYIQQNQNCMKNGRPDTGYLDWKWQPQQCELSRIDAATFLTAMRDKSMYFVGDSLARNQFQALLCILSQAEDPNHAYQGPDDKDNVYVFRSYNFTLAVYWSTRLVHVEDKLITFPDNSTLEVAHIHLDKLDKAWVERVPGVDIVQISTGQWWFKRSLFYLEGQPIGAHWYDDGGHTCADWKECTKTIGFADPFRMAIHNALQGSLSISGYTGTTILRTFSPDHFEDGQWHNGGKCVRTTPGDVPMRDLTKWMYDFQIQEFQNVTGALSGAEKKRLKLLDITNLAQIRSDGHPDAYRNFQPFSKERKQPVQRDCLHWCIPGPIDTWNELLVATLRQ